MIDDAVAVAYLTVTYVVWSLLRAYEEHAFLRVGRITNNALFFVCMC